MKLEDKEEQRSEEHKEWSKASAEYLLVEVHLPKCPERIAKTERQSPPMRPGTNHRQVVGFPTVGMKESFQKGEERITGKIGKQRVAGKPVRHIEPDKQGRNTENPIDGHLRCSLHQRQFADEQKVIAYQSRRSHHIEQRVVLRSSRHPEKDSRQHQPLPSSILHPAQQRKKIQKAEERDGQVNVNRA